MGFELDIRTNCLPESDVVVDLAVDTEGLLAVLAEEWLGTGLYGKTLRNGFIW